MKVSIKAQMDEILKDYTVDLIRATNNAQDDVAKKTAQRLRNTSPKRAKGGRHYANGWTVKRDRPVAGLVKVTVYNKTKPQLTHLLERGHVVKNGKGEYGRAPAHPHILPAEEWAANEIVAQIERKLK